MKKKLRFYKLQIFLKMENNLFFLRKKTRYISRKLYVIATFVINNLEKIN